MQLASCLRGALVIVGALTLAAPGRGAPGDFVAAVASTPTRLIHSGQRAPDFGYRSQEGGWVTLGELRGQADVLLVFGADEPTLAALQRERDDLLGAGVLPVAVLDRPDPEVWRTVSRLDITYSALSDPAHNVAGLYGAVDPTTGHTGRAWCVVDRGGHVRAAGLGIPVESTWSVLALEALGRPLPGQPQVTGLR